MPPKTDIKKSWDTIIGPHSDLKLEDALIELLRRLRHSDMVIMDGLLSIAKEHEYRS